MDITQSPEPELARHFRISSRSHHGLLFVTELARRQYAGSATPTSVRCIAQELKLSEKYLEELVRALRQADIISGTRGRGGGYRLARDPREITMGMLVRVLDGPVVLAHCQDASVQEPCPKESRCATKTFFTRLKHSIDRELDAMSLHDLMAIADVTFV